MAENSLAVNSRFAAALFNAPPIVAIAGAIDTTIVAKDFNTFKLQGSKDNGATYADIAGSALTGAGAGTLGVMSVYRCQAFDHIKVVMDAGNVTFIQHRPRAVPYTPAAWPTTQNGVVTPPSALIGNLIDPQLGAAAGAGFTQ